MATKVAKQAKSPIKDTPNASLGKKIGGVPKNMPDFTKKGTAVKVPNVGSKRGR